MKTEPLSIDSAPTTYDITRMDGPNAILTPYARGFFRRDLPYHIWALMEKEDATKLVFYEIPNNAADKASSGDLVHFVNYFSNDPSKLLLVVTDRESGEIAGICWFDIQCDRFRALANWWMRRKFWGHFTREAGVIACDYMFGNIGVQHLWGYSPWPTSAKSGMSFGFEYMIALPDYLTIGGKPRDMHIVHLSKERFRDGGYFENLHQTDSRPGDEYRH